MKRYLWLLLLVCVFGCDRCEREEAQPDCRTLKATLDTAIHVYNFTYEHKLGAASPSINELRTLEIDSLRYPSYYLFWHKNNADSVAWHIEGEASWRKGDSLTITFEDVRLRTITIKKRVWGDRAKDCSDIARNYYETSQTFPVKKRQYLWPNDLFSGYSSEFKRKIDVSVKDSTFFKSGMYEMYYYIYGLVNFWPKSGYDYYTKQVFASGNRLFWFEYADIEPARKMRGYLYSLTPDSIRIDYAYGNFPQKTFTFTGVRK